MKVAALTFSQIHGKNPPSGSSLIRIHQMLKYWPELSLYQYGSHANVLLLQKVYVLPDYSFPTTYPGIRILDVADADWLDGALIKQTVDGVHAITCPTETLAKFIRQMTTKPVMVIPDRYDLEDFPTPKQHLGEAKTVVWFGYRHNIETLRPAMDLVSRLGLNLLVISNDDPMPWQWLDRAAMDEFRHDRYKFVKYPQSAHQVHMEIQAADFAVLPKGTRPQDVFKSDNKHVRAILCGLPVASTSEEVEALIAPQERSQWVKTEYNKTQAEFDIKKSVQQYQDLIVQLEGVER